MLKRFLIFIVLLTGHASVAWSATDLHFGNYHALVIGNNDYGDLPKLKTAVNDAKSVAALLESDYAFNVQLLLNATRNEIIRALAKLRGDLGPNDNLLIYYAGHGVLDEYANQGYWLPVDAEKDSPGNWISNGDITDATRAMRAKHVLVVADSCYSGTLVRAAAVTIENSQERDAWLKRMINKRSRTALVSGGLEPVIDSGGGGKHSVFAKAFLDALTENRDVLDGQAMFAAVKRPVALESDQTPQYSDIRRSGHDGGDFLLVRRNVTTRGIAVAPRSDQGTEPGATTQSPPPPASQAIELAFWNSIKDSENPDEFEAYLAQFPSGVFAGLAKTRLKSLVPEQKTAAVVAPPKPATPSAVKPAVGVFPDLKPGDTFKDCDVCPEMVVIPAGTFMMGSSEAERRWAVDQGGPAEWTKREGPRHRVTIGNAFVLGKFEVTRDEFAAFAKETGHDASGGCTVWLQSKSELNAIKSWRNPAFTQTGRDPVACVSWQDATAYVSWLSRKAGEQYRLPSESEWEYAARAGTETMRYWGEDHSNSEACGYDNGWDITGTRGSGIQNPALSCDDGQVFTSPVGSYRANRLGLYDVLGNVGEWVEDCLHDSYADAPSDGSPWTTGECKFRVVRGGSWASTPGLLRSAVRLWLQPNFNNQATGSGSPRH